MLQVRKVATHSFYSAPTASQLAGAHVLRHGDDWLRQAAALYQESGDRAAETIGVPPAEGGTFLFVDVSQRFDERGLEGFLHDCLDRNLILAPGTACGTAYSDHVRVCFTCARPEVVQRGFEALARLLGR
jgi:aspartate/methionine/tyrosine aminotransferase